MKKILLLGDSIRQNYQEYVAEDLKDKAKVYYPNDNGKFTHVTLRYLHEWIRVFSREDEKPFDIIHFNCGLWDVLRLSNEDRTFSSETEYAEMLKRISERMHYLCPNAKIIFALTTSVIEPGVGKFSDTDVLEMTRCNSDIVNFNRIAQKTLELQGVEINDLWSISEGLPIEARSDRVHFETDMGKRALADGVVKCIKKYL